jgi:hypothetical protein
MDVLRFLRFLSVLSRVGGGLTTRLNTVQEVLRTGYKIAAPDSI